MSDCKKNGTTYLHNCIGSYEGQIIFINLFLFKNNRSISLLPLWEAQIGLFDLGLGSDCCLGDSCLSDNEWASNFF